MEFIDLLGTIAKEYGAGATALVAALAFLWRQNKQNRIDSDTQHKALKTDIDSYSKRSDKRIDEVQVSIASNRTASDNRHDAVQSSIETVVDNQESMQREQNESTVTLAKIETNLEHGERRFEVLEGRASKHSEKLDAGEKERARLESRVGILESK